MGEPLKSEKTVREYLLGRVSDEATLEGLEELLFTDEEFSSRVALTEDDLVNDYVLGQLDEADAASFRATLSNNPGRRRSLELARVLRAKALAGADSPAAAPGRAAAHARPSFLASLGGFFRRPAYAFAFAALLVAATASAVYLFRSADADELAELRSVYRQERPTEARISDFGYAPLTQLRGAPASRDPGTLRRLELRLLEAREKNPSAQTLHALGSFLITQHDYAGAVRELEGALKLGGGGARIHNDLGVAYFEQAKASPPERRLELLARGLEEFTDAADGGSLEALFNKSLALQELGMPRQARESWTLYLQKDPSSPWAEEARRNLSRIAAEQTRFRTEEQVLADFLDAYRVRDEERALKIHDETKGLLRGAAVPLQLSRRYLAARLRGDEAAARESVEAMAFVGRFEQTRYGEFFFLS